MSYSGFGRKGRDEHSDFRCNERLASTRGGVYRRAENPAVVSLPGVTGPERDADLCLLSVHSPGSVHRSAPTRPQSWSGP